MEIQSTLLPTTTNFINLLFHPEPFGRLTVQEFIGKDKSNQFYWLCKCSCGNSVSVTSRRLISGKTKSCGCLRAELLRSRRIVHGLSTFPEYNSWKTMISRCCVDTNSQYKDYGGRGIEVCKEWIDSFPDFLVDMGRRPTPKHTLDRINNDKNYCFENCKWSTRKEQNRNKRLTVIIDYNGIQTPLVELAERFNIKRETLASRIRLGREINEALTTPIRNKSNKTITLADISEIDIKDSLLYDCVAKRKT